MFFEFEKKVNPEKNKKLDVQEVLQKLRKKGVENETNAEPGAGEPDSLEYNVRSTEINLEDIEDAEQTQLREHHSDAVIKELKRLFTATKEADCSDKGVTARIPDITVVQKPKSKGKFWIIDGHHRYLAAKAAGVKRLTVQIANPKLFKVANLDDLHFLQARENATTQANRSTPTKFAAAEAVLKHHHHWTNNQVARYCTISSAIVAAVRSRLESTGKIPKHEKPQAKAAAAVDNPENAKKSNRALAKELGVGEATVRRARQDSTQKNDAVDPACLKCGKTLPPKRRKGLSYTAENGEKVKFCCRECVQAYAAERDLILDERNHILSAKPKLKPEAAEEVHATPEEEVQDADSAALDKVSSRAQHWVESHKPKCFHGYDTVAELDERKEQNTRGWTIEQLAEFEEGVQAYEKSDRNKPYPRTSDWSDEKLEGFIYAEERERISEREARRNDEQQQKEETPELPDQLETGDGVQVSPDEGDQYIRTPVPIYKAFESFFRRQRQLKTPEEVEAYENGRTIWRKEGHEADISDLNDIETIGYFDEMEIQTTLRRYGRDVELWKKEPGYRRKTKGVGEVIYQNDWAFIDEIKRILERVEPGIWISREDLTKGHIFSLVDYIYNLLGCQASLFSDLFAEKVKSKKNGSGNA